MFCHKPTRIIFIRHAESVANDEHRMQGWSDDPLSVRGHKQAQQLAHWLQHNNPHADALFASPLRRTMQTATYVSDALGLPIQTREHIKELGLGLLEDCHGDVLFHVLKEENFEQTYYVETLPVFGERVLGALYGLIAIHGGGTLVVVTHGGVIGMALSYWIAGDINLTWSDYGYTQNTAMTELVFGKTVERVRFNEQPHLTT